MKTNTKGSKARGRARRFVVRIPGDAIWGSYSSLTEAREELKEARRLGNPAYTITRK